MIDFLDSVKGSLYGFAIGDAMGASTEFMTAKAISDKYGKLQNIVGGGWLGLEKGQVTDDTEMMLCVYRGIRDDPKNPLSQICKQFKSWLESGPIDIGSACLRAISSARTNDPEEWTRRSEERQRSGRMDYGNGGLMRCLVPCLMGEEDLAIQQSALTHSNVTCDEAVTLYFHTLWKSVKCQKPYHTNHVKPSGHVWNTLTNARYWLGATESFRDAIIGAVNDGGDADTIAALTGGLAGAFYGYASIPETWISQLNSTVREQLDECCEFIIGREGS